MITRDNGDYGDAITLAQRLDNGFAFCPIKLLALPFSMRESYWRQKSTPESYWRSLFSRLKVYGAIF